jgi:type VI secretion system secreted protein Hcp
MAIYVKIDGVEGDVTAAGHEGWINCDSMSWGVSRAIGNPTGSAKERESTAPMVQDVSLSKAMDSATPLLFQEACVGKSKPVEIHLVQTGADQLDSYMEYKLTNALVSSYSLSSGGDRPMENFSLNFTKIESKYTPFDDEHNAGSPMSAGYDMAAGKKV